MSEFSTLRDAHIRSRHTAIISLGHCANLTRLHNFDQASFHQDAHMMSHRHPVHDLRSACRAWRHYCHAQLTEFEDRIATFSVALDHTAICEPDLVRPDCQRTDHSSFLPALCEHFRM